jgi:hypothetical protein
VLQRSTAVAPVPGEDLLPSSEPLDTYCKGVGTSELEGRGTEGKAKEGTRKAKRRASKRSKKVIEAGIRRPIILGQQSDIRRYRFQISYIVAQQIG